MHRFCFFIASIYFLHLKKGIEIEVKGNSLIIQLCFPTGFEFVSRKNQTFEVLRSKHLKA